MFFVGMNAFIAYFATRVASADQHIAAEVKRAAEIIEQDAKARIGNYEPAVGPFPAWAPLADSTLNGVDINGHHFPGKIELGYAPPDNPLLREGDLRNSIQHSATGPQASVGSNDQKAMWQERGTKTIPPRSFLGGAAAHLSDPVAHRVGHVVYEVLAGLRP